MSLNVFNVDEGKVVRIFISLEEYRTLSSD